MRFYLPHALWTINILVYILLIWWGMFWWSGHDDWYAYQYLFITLYAITLFFLAAMLYPWDMDKDIDVERYYFRNRVWFFGAMAVAWLVDVPETVIKASADLRPVPQEYFVFIGLHLGIAVIGLVARHATIHLLLPIAWLFLTIYYVFSSIVGQISI